MGKQPKLKAKDNGYFEVWEKPDGEIVRVYTEDRQFEFRSISGAKTRFHDGVRVRLSEEAA